MHLNNALLVFMSPWKFRTDVEGKNLHFVHNL